jgi:DNA polymerase I-like protein with 3'-5' exonuclease and polymerase domains
MDTLCTLCHQWTALPEHVPGGNGVHVQCAACANEIPARGIAHRYRTCRLCGQHYLADLGHCPVCPEPGDAVGGAAWLTLLLDGDARPGGLGPAARDWVPLSDQYGLTLWADYQQEQSGARERSGGDNGRGNGRSPGRGSRSATNGTGGTARPAAAPPPPPILPPAPAVLFETDTPDTTSIGGEITVVANEGLDGVEYELIQDADRLAEVADLLAAEPTLAVDTETTGLDPYSVKLLLIQVATPQKVYVIDVPRVNPLPLKPLLESPRILKLLQNAKFDYEILRHLAGIEVCNLFDTMLAERLLTAGRYGARSETGLKALSRNYLGIVMDKTARKGFIGAVGDQYLESAQLLYAARDVEVLFGIWRQQAALLRKEKLEKVAQLEFQCVPAVGDMELAGVAVDVARWRLILEGVAVQRDQAAAELTALLDEVMPQRTMFGVSSINLNSNQQLMEVFRRLGVELEDTSEATLTKVQAAHPAVAKLLEYRTHEKTLSAFGEHILGLINPATNRIHPDFQQYGADTGRFSCTKPNVQQIPATSDFRSCFIAAPGYKLVTCDYSQAELRILAELSEDPGFVSAFVSGGDLHAITASQMFNVPLEQVTKTQRSAAKSINFGLAYGRGAGSLALQLGVSPDEARALIETYFKAYRGVQKWLDGAARQGVTKGYTTTLLGRKRYYDVPAQTDPDYRSKIASIERQAKNSPIQGGNADMTKIALVYLREALQGLDARVVNTVHDEIVVEAAEGIAEQVKHIVEFQMIRAGQEILRHVPVVADAAIGDYWKK